MQPASLKSSSLESAAQALQLLQRPCGGTPSAEADFGAFSAQSFLAILNQNVSAF